ncbi:MAG TPA: ABC transporter permease [Anaerolineaceae bacterium]
MLTMIEMLRIVFRRLRHNLGLTISSLVGLIAVLTITVCVPVYSQAVAGEVLRQQLIDKRGTTHRPIFALRMKYDEVRQGAPMTLDKVRTISDFLMNRLVGDSGLPVDQLLVDVRAGSLIITDLSGRYPDAKNSPFSRWSFVVMDNLLEHIHIVEGRLPTSDPPKDGIIEVLITADMADEMALKLGDIFLADPFQVRLVGFWEAKNMTDKLWYNLPDGEYDRTMWIPEAVYRSNVAPNLPSPIETAIWYAIIKDQDLRYQRASQYLRGLTRLNVDIQRLVSGIKTEYTPMDALVAYETRAESLATLFYVVGSPMVVLALIFIGLTARIAVQEVEGEIATMRARGTSPLQIALLNVAESTVLLLIALSPSIVSGWLAANLMGSTVSFLQFTQRSNLSFTLDGINIWVILVASIIVIVARFLPMIQASRITILRVRQEQTRSSTKPFWERFFLDFFLLIPGGYAYFIQKGWSKPAQFLSSLQLSTDQQFRDPLLFVAPALFAIALCMIMVRLLPLFIRVLAAIVEKLPGVWAYLSLQQVARRSKDHSSALLLIMISLSLAIFTVSTAKTLDRWLYDSEYYKVGADLAVQEFIPLGGGSGDGGPPSQSQLVENYLTIEEHLAIPGVVGATRAGKYDGKFSYGRGDTSCYVIGIDRLDFLKTAYFRDDFANESMGALMNALGMNLEGVIFPAELMKKNNILMGDKIAVTINVGSAKYERELTVVGSYNYFPTVFPKDRATLIMNLESIFNYPDDVEGYTMLLDLAPDADPSLVLRNIQEMLGSRDAVVKVPGNAMEAVMKGQDKPERMGLFGILNVGFIATGLMPGIGFLLYSYASLRRRFIQLGILQAIGLSVKQLVASLVSEQSILMGMAILTGAATGLLTSVLFVPFLQTGATPGAPVPPFLVLIGWAESGLLSLVFGVVLIITMLATIIYLARLKMFQAVKLGETL